MKEALLALEEKKNLSSELMTQAMEEIMSGNAQESEIESFLILLRDKGEEVEEIVAATHVMRRHALSLSQSFKNLVDSCGTGGDGQHTLNVSTLAALVASSAGVCVGKHGNRAVSSRCGSADILEALGIKIDLPLDKIEQCILKYDFGFFFAPKFHPALRHAMPARKKISGKTLFNILGPLSNPGGAKRQVIGVYHKSLVPKVALALRALGAEKALVVHAASGMDEIGLSSETYAALVTRDSVRHFEIKPEDFLLNRGQMSAIQCNDLEAATKAAREVLAGGPGPGQDVVAMNAGAVIYVADKAETLFDGFLLAKKFLASGAAEKKLSEIALFSSNADF